MHRKYITINFLKSYCEKSCGHRIKQAIGYIMISTLELKGNLLKMYKHNKYFRVHVLS